MPKTKITAARDPVRGGTKINYKRVGLIIGLPLFIFLFNLVLVAPLLIGEYNSLSYSEQPIYLKIIQFIRENWPTIGWADFWQGGFSFPLIFSPFVPFLTLFLRLFLGNEGHILRVLGALSYALIPVSLYVFIRILSKRRIAAFIAVFSFSPLPSVMGLFISGIKESSARYFYAPWHFIYNLLGDTPRILALALIPLAAANFLLILKKATFKKIIFGAVLIALVALIDFASFFSLLILLFVLFFSEVLLSDKTVQGRLGVFTIVLIIAVGLFSFWYHPEYISNFFRFGAGGGVGDDLMKIIPYFILITPWLIIGLFYLFGYRKHLQSLFVSLGWFSLTFFVGFSYFFFGRSFLPEAPRYLIEINMAFCLTIGVLITHFFDWIGRIGAKKHRLAGFFRSLFLLGAVLILIIYNFPFIKNAWSYNRPLRDVSQEKIYALAQWFEKNVPAGESRVYLAVDGKNWFNIWAKIPQLSGPLPEKYFSRSSIETVNKYFADSGDETTFFDLAKATNTEYFVVDSDSLFGVKFKNIAVAVGEIKGLKIYQVNLTNNRIIQKINLEELNSLDDIDQILAQGAILSYLDWQERLIQEEIDYRIINPQKIEIKGNFKKEEGILVKMNHSPAFIAKEGDKELIVQKDPLGFMVIKPQKEGEQTIELKYGFYLSQGFGISLTILTVFFLFVYRLRARKRNISQKEP
ncbi:MAG: hypothetical protein ABIH38_03975 [Patescibacteria group bacterium]